MNSKYDLLTISAIVSVFYFASYLLYKLSFIHSSTHRKIWNFVLLISFLISGILGILFVIQINYKLKIPFLDTIMLLHVDIGIAMVLIAFFHIFRHLNYFKRIMVIKNSSDKKNTQEKSISEFSIQSSNSTFDEINRINFKIPVIVLGFSAIITQILFLREFLSVFYGNELVVAIVIFNWMLLTGLGAYVGKTKKNKLKKEKSLLFLQCFVAVLPLILIFLLNYLRNIVFQVGAMVHIFQIFYISLILLFPFCFISGFLFTLYADFFSEKYQQNMIAKVYTFETVGSIAAGIFCSLISFYFFSVFDNLSFLFIINNLVAFYIAFKIIKNKKKYWFFTPVLFGIFLFSIDIDKFIKQQIYVNQEIVALTETPYGQIVITKSTNQYNFYENGTFLFSTDNTTESEEAVHYVMLQHTNPKNILLLSGGIAGLTNEIIKYDIDKIDYIEQNPALIELGKKFTKTLENKKINTIADDANHFILNSSTKYDIVIIHLPEPSTLNLNRFYSNEFFVHLKSKLNKNAVVSLSLNSTANYVSNESNQINSVIYNTLKNNFTHIEIIAGTKNYFIASDTLLSLNITQLAEKKAIQTVYVNPYYLDDQAIISKSKLILSKLNQNAEINSNFQPVAFFSQMKYWLSQFNVNIWLILLCITIIFIFFLKNMSVITIGLFTGGFASAGFEILLLTFLQIFYGNIYQNTGILFAVFMLGLALGSQKKIKRFSEKKITSYAIIQSAIILYSIVFPFVICFLGKFRLNEIANHIIILFLTFIIAIFTGFEFAFVSEIRKNNTQTVAAENYSSDLFGSALGVILISIVLFPLTGIFITSWFIGFLNLLSLIALLLKSNKITNV